MIIMLYYQAAWNFQAIYLPAAVKLNGAERIDFDFPPLTDEREVCHESIGYADRRGCKGFTG